jgi:hypothetical protein
VSALVLRLPRAVRAAAALAASALVFAAACSTAPGPAPAIVSEGGVVATAVSRESLEGQGLLPPYPACCPGTDCCQPPYYCAYFDTPDATLGDAGAGLTPLAGLRLEGRSPNAGVGAACKRVNAPAYAAPIAIATVLSYDYSMDYGQGVSSDSDSWFVDAARRGIGDFATNGSLSNGMLGGVARQPLWPGADGWCYFWGTCSLSCSTAEYRGASSSLYTLASQGGTMLSVLPDPSLGDDFTEMGPQNPVQMGWRAARQRLYDYWSTAPNGKITTLGIALAVSEQANGCSSRWAMDDLNDDIWNGVWNRPAGMPPVYTHVSGYYMYQNAYDNYFNVLRLNGFGAGYYFWPGSSDGTARVAMKNGLSFFRVQDRSRAFYVNPPANGEVIDDASFKFYLSIDGVETLLPNAGSQAACGNVQPGYWLSRPEGAAGRILVNLCPVSVVAAANAVNMNATSARVTYDCVEQFPASATFVRTFDLSRCASSDTTRSRALRFDYAVDHTADTYVTFRVRFAPRAGDLLSAPVATTFSSLAWVPASWSTFVDLGNPATVSLPANYQYARVEMQLVSSSDLRRSPTVKNWKLTFTCMDGN